MKIWKPWWNLYDSHYSWPKNLQSPTLITNHIQTHKTDAGNNHTFTMLRTTPAPTIPSPATIYGKNTCNPICHHVSVISSSCFSSGLLTTGTSFRWVLSPSFKGSDGTQQSEELEESDGLLFPSNDTRSDGLTLSVACLRCRTAFMLLAFM